MREEFMERSEKILKGLGNQYYRATLKSMGFTTEDLKRPVIGIANAWSECVPGHYNLRQVAGGPAGEGRHLPGRRHAH